MLLWDCLFSARAWGVHAFPLRPPQLCPRSAPSAPPALPRWAAPRLPSPAGSPVRPRGAGSLPLPDRSCQPAGAWGSGRQSFGLALCCSLGAEVGSGSVPPALAGRGGREGVTALRTAVSPAGGRPRGRNPPAGLWAVPSTNKTALSKCEPESPPVTAWAVNQHGHRGPHSPVPSEPAQRGPRLQVAGGWCSRGS